MSTHRSYFSKNNTIISESLANTGRNPITDLYFGTSSANFSQVGYTRFIFNLNLVPLFEKILDGTITTECTDNLTHTLTMTNTIRFDDELLNTYNSDERRRASSFDLILFRIPQSSCFTATPITTTTTTTSPVTTTTTTSPVTTTTTTIIPDCVHVPQEWDEGVGYDYYNTRKSLNNPTGTSVLSAPLIDKEYSTRPSNWYQTSNLDFWSEPGIYNNENSGHSFNYENLVIVDTQHFAKGNEDINFDMTDEINGIIDGTITGVTGWGIAYRPEFELITGLTSNYSVSFFNRHTQTFYEPYLLTTYDDLIKDDRNLFVERKTNKLYLFAYVDGDLVTLDENPTVSILDDFGDIIPGLIGLPTCPRTKGVYEVEIPPMTGFSTPCQFSDIWTNIKYNGVELPDIENEFALQPYKNRIIVSTQSREPEIFGFDFYGIKQDEKILNTDIRKVGVVIKKAYTTKQLLQNVDASYRVYVREGNTEVQVQEWTKVNRTPNEYYFIFDTRDKIPNEYYIDIKVNTSGEVDTYKRTIKFQIVNKK
jgi:hypothetical protein